MHPLDQANIEFSEDQLTLLNLLLAFLMFSVSIELKKSDFAYIFKKPKAYFTGLFSQWIMLPLVTMIIIILGKPYPGIAMGMLLVACCPGGNVSNYAVHLAKGNTALSIAMTSTVTLLAMITTPTLFFLGQKFLPYCSIDQVQLQIPFVKMFINILTIIFIPLLLGLLLSSRLPDLVNKVKKFVKTAAFLMFLAFVLVVLYTKRELLVTYLNDIFTWVFLHNILALAVGFGCAALMKFKWPEKKAITIETGIQNSGLALILIFNFFDGAGAMALIAACWGVWHLVSGFLLAVIFAKIK